MLTAEYVKALIQKLYDTNPNVHISITMQRAKISVKDTPVVIKGVYRHIFQVEEVGVRFPKCYSIQYAEVLIGKAVIPELGLLPQIPPKH